MISKVSAEPKVPAEPKKYGRTTILINSAFRANKSQPTTDFVYQFPETVRNVVHTNLLTAVVENGVYNVVGGQNDTLVLVNSATSVITGSVVNNNQITVGQEMSWDGLVMTPSDAIFKVGSTIYGKTTVDSANYTFTATVVAADTIGNISFLPTVSSGLLPSILYALVTWALSTTTVPVESSLITIPPGYYDVSTLCSTLSSLLNNVNTITNNLIPPTRSMFFVEVNSQGILSISNNISGQWSIQMRGQGIQKLLGFTLFATDGPPSIAPVQWPFGPYTVKGNVPIYLNNYDLLLIQSDQLGNQITTRQGFNAWAVIPATNFQNSSTTITYDNVRSPSLETSWKVPKLLEWVDIRLVDTNGTVVDIGQNNMQVVVECYTDDSLRQ